MKAQQKDTNRDTLDAELKTWLMRPIVYVRKQTFLQKTQRWGIIRDRKKRSK